MRSCFLVAVLIYVIALSGAASAQIVADGQIAELSTEIGRLVHLTWKEDRIRVDHNHWDAKSAPKTDEEEKAEEIEAMVKRGIPKRIAEKMIAGGGGRGGRRGPFGGAGFLTASPEGKLFQDLKAAAGAMSGGGGGGGEEMHWDGRGNDLSLSMHRTKHNGFRLMIRESAAPFQEIIVEDHDVKGLRIQFSSPTRQLVLSHDERGSIRVAHTSEERNDAFTTANYQEMAKTHPEFTSDFVAMLDRLGINQPLTDSDPLIVKAVAELLIKPDSESSNQAMDAITRLDDKEFKKREAAQSEIAENFNVWRSIIDEQLQSKDMKAEARVRLERIQAAHGGENKPEVKYVRRRKLLDNADYLSSVLDKVPANLKPHVERRLAELKSGR